MSAAWRVLPLLAVTLLAGCLAPGFEVGDARVCEAPVAGFDRLTEVGIERGLEPAPPLSLEAGGGCNLAPGGTLAHDLDGDGDVDLAFHDPGGFPHLFANDGSGRFTRVAPDPTVEDGLEALDSAFLGLAAVDLDGDGLPALALTGPSLLVVLDNPGELAFAPPRVLFRDESWPRACHLSMTWGDVDGDGDLDVFLPGVDPVLEPGWMPEEPIPEFGTWDRLLLNDGGTFTTAALLAPAGVPWLSMTAHFTDRDGDGDLDLLAGTDRIEAAPPPGGLTGFYRNDGLDGDGLPVLVDDAPEVGAASRVNAMGLDARDFNTDGLLDYCIGDAALALACLASDPSGVYVLTGQAQGLVSDAPSNPEWTGGAGDIALWGVVFVDLDNDGEVDGAAAAGAHPDFGGVQGSMSTRNQPNELWRGTGDGLFESRAHQTGFATLDDSIGLVAADLSGDGFPELIVGRAEGEPLLWNNPCGDGAWVQVELVGPRGNREGYGAQVVVESAEGRIDRQEMSNLRGFSQGPSRLHFGLASDAALRSLEVFWPDGRVSEASRVPVNRLVTVTHPESGG